MTEDELKAIEARAKAYREPHDRACFKGTRGDWHWSDDSLALVAEVRRLRIISSALASQCENLIASVRQVESERDAKHEEVLRLRAKFPECPDCGAPTGMQPVTCGCAPPITIIRKAACGTSKTPKGWACTRLEGHEGPCAAWPIPE